MQSTALNATKRAGWTLLCICVAVAEPIIGISIDALRSAALRAPVDLPG